MLSYLVIGICIFLLVAVVYISAKPISMGIEARRNIKDNNSDDENEDEKVLFEKQDEDDLLKSNISDEILKLSRLKNDGVISEDEFQKAKKKLLS